MWKRRIVFIYIGKDRVINLKLTSAAKEFIQNATADDASLKLRFYGVRSADGMIIGADIDTLVDTDHIIEIEGFQIGISPEVLPNLELVTVHVDTHQHQQGIILFNYN